MVKVKKLLVAITGGISSGKSTFISFLNELGYPTILADDISKEILTNDPDVRKEVMETFGAESFQGDRINKNFLADQVFSNFTNLKKINSIIHPRVRKKIDSISKDYFKFKSIVFVEAALIYESKIEKMYDYVVLLVTDMEIRMKRSVEAKKISEQDFIKRNENQLDDSIKKKKADFIFTNNGSERELKQKAILLSTILNSILLKNNNSSNPN